MKFYLHTRGNIFEYEANSIREAFRKFFLDVKNGKIPVSELGQIILCSNVKNDIDNAVVCRVAPILFALNIIDLDTYRDNVALIAGSDEEFSDGELLLWAENDSSYIFGK